MTRGGGRTTAGGEADARRHWRKSLQFAAAARLEAGQLLPTPAYSNAILSVMHAADALCLHYLGLRSSSQDHQQAAQLFETITEIPSSVRTTFRRHLADLLEVKSLVQYAGDEFNAEDAAKALTHMERALGAIQHLAASFGSA